MTGGSDVLTTMPHVLPPIIDRAAAAMLAAELRSVRGAVLDGSRVERIGQAGLQLLLSARATASADEASFAIQAPSGALCRAAELAGLSAALALPESD